jgi:hypothetical protein
MRAISVDRMSYKDASAKQTQDYCDRFNHLDAPYYWYVYEPIRVSGRLLRGRKMVLMPAVGPWSAAIVASRHRRPGGDYRRDDLRISTERRASVPRSRSETRTRPGVPRSPGLVNRNDPLAGRSV